MNIEIGDVVRIRRAPGTTPGDLGIVTEVRELVIAYSGEKYKVAEAYIGNRSIRLALNSFELVSKRK